MSQSCSVGLELGFHLIPSHIPSIGGGATRRHTALRVQDLGRLTTGLGRALPFLVAADHRPATLDRLDLRTRLLRQPEQLSLFG